MAWGISTLCLSRIRVYPPYTPPKRSFVSIKSFRHSLQSISINPGKWSAFDNRLRDLSPKGSAGRNDVGYEVAPCVAWAICAWLNGRTPFVIVTVCVPCPSVWVTQAWFIEGGERVLEEIFGERYLNFREKVRHWL